jgi:Cu+-exporting ATPase
VLFKDAEAIELLRAVDTLVVDKTGTLTRASRAGRTHAHGRVRRGGGLRLAASLERSSEHPLAAAIVNEPTERGLALAQVRSSRRSREGRARNRGGSPRRRGERALFASWASSPARRRASAQAPCLVADRRRSGGVISVADPIKASTREAVQQLHADGLRLVMLTGDQRANADAVAAELGIDEVIAEVLPDQKAQVVQRLQREGRSSRWRATGSTTRPRSRRPRSGSRWAPAPTSRSRARAITLVQGDLRAVARARALSRATMRNVRQNLFFAFVYNALGVPVARGRPVSVVRRTAVADDRGAAMSLSSVSVIANALRLRRVSL